jgi:hypothetical protein
VVQPRGARGWNLSGRRVQIDCTLHLVEQVACKVVMGSVAYHVIALERAFIFTSITVCCIALVGINLRQTTQRMPAQIWQSTRSGSTIAWAESTCQLDRDARELLAEEGLELGALGALQQPLDKLEVD